jgi:cysteine-rich repeat protein
VVEWGPLDTTVQVAVCGNGIIECTETCDDGNTEAGDGCSADCRLEYWPCGYVLGGDTNVDGVVNAADVIFEIRWIYKSGPPPEPCIAFGDINCNGAFTASDILNLVDYVFKGGPEPCDPCFSPMVVQCEY